jgi:small subunit ribosomal protein S10
MKQVTATKSKSNKAKPAGEEVTPQRIRIKIRAYDHKLADQSARQIVEVVKKTGAEVAGPVPLPTERKLFTVQRATFIKKDARDQFEIRVHKRLIDITSPNSKTMEQLMSLNLPGGVDVEMKT